MSNVRQLLREQIEIIPKKVIINKFLNFVKDDLELTKPFKLTLTTNKDGIRTTAVYNHVENTITIYIKNRALVDVLRSIAHELVHHLQNQRGELDGTKNEGDDGSPWENEANARAGKLIRMFGREYPNIYTL
jgi:Zn-dependent peptidase ImmA (M78 family)